MPPWPATFTWARMERLRRGDSHAPRFALLQTLRTRMLRPQYAAVLKGDYSSGQLLSFVKHFRFALGMRLHFLIFAVKCGVPFVALPYASKVHGLLEALRIEMPPLELVNEGRLIAYLDKLWDHQRELKAAMRQALPDLTAKARQTHEIAVQFLKEQARDKDTTPASIST